MNIFQLLNVDESCPRISKEKEEQNKLPEVKRMIKKCKDLFKYLTEKSGAPVESILDVDYLFDTLEIEVIRISLLIYLSSIGG